MQRIRAITGFVIVFVVSSGCGPTASDPDDNDNNNTNTNNNTNAPVTCETAQDCAADEECCRTPDAPLVDGEQVSVCTEAGRCCDCFGSTTCERCVVGAEVCVEVEAGESECQPASCDYPGCSSSDDCPTDEICCNSDSENTCDGCRGTCRAPTAAECTSTGWECGNGPYASAQPAQPRGSWYRRHGIIPVPVKRQMAATIMATFQWRHSAGRPPRHDFALGLGADRAPAFQVFGRGDHSYARCGLQMVRLQKNQRYQLSLVLEPTGTGTQAHASLVRLADDRTVMHASTRIDGPVRSLWQEILGPVASPLSSRLLLEDLQVQMAAAPSDDSLAQRECSAPRAADHAPI